tara:strand:- start:2798 stop:4147 length:1350 start_codon:yes stop_codon:yes gene_type:complete
MGFFDSALKNIVKKAKPLLPVAAMAAAPMLYPKMAAFMGAGGKGAGLGSLLGNYMGKYSALPMLAKAPLTSAATSYGLAKLMGQRNPERAALYSALASMPFAFMKANAYANALDGEGGISAFDVLKAPGGEELMSTTFSPRVQDMKDLTYTDIIKRGPVDSAMMEVEKVRPAIPGIQRIANTKSYPGLGLEDLFRNLEARKGILGNEIAKGSFDLRAALPLLAGYTGAQPTEDQMKEDMEKEERDRMAMLYDLMKNPYYSHVPESFDFIPYASAKGGAVQKYDNGGPVEGPYMDPMPSDDFNINVQEIIQGPGYEAIDDLDIFQEAGSSGMHPLVEFKEMYDQYILDGGELSFKEFFDMIQVELDNEVEAKSGGITELNLTAGGASNGPGTGTSDSIPAKLSDGEFVMTAKAVENFGGGDRYEGARKMYKMMNTLDPNSEKPSEAKTIV